MKIKKIRFDCIFYILIALGLVALLAWSTKAEIARNPSREASLDLGPHGFVTVQLQTDPYPARPSDTVELNFMLTNSRNVTFIPDSITYEYGPEGTDQPIGLGSPQPMPAGGGMLMAGAQFPSVGKWWLRVTVSKDGYQDDVAFTIDVQPAP